MNKSSGTDIYKVDSLEHFLGKFDATNLALLIDENVNHHFGAWFEPYYKFIIPSGEEQKNISTIDHVIRFLMDSGIDRKGSIIGIGGGVVCDITGFAASIYLRGVSFGFLPSTLLAMCDAAIGGKNGVNFQSAKNVIGVINQPQFIGYHHPFLDTLPQEEYTNGMAEVIKHAFLDGLKFIDYLKENYVLIKSRDMLVLEKMITWSHQVKSKIVEKDEMEQGERKKLNLGHTLGHAIEVNSNLSHGQSVSIGMHMAAKIAHQKKLCAIETCRIIEELCKLFDLPLDSGISSKPIMDSIVYDKKRKSGEIDFVIPIAPGKVEILAIPLEELEDLIK